MLSTHNRRKGNATWETKAENILDILRPRGPHLASNPNCPPLELPKAKKHYIHDLWYQWNFAQVSPTNLSCFGRASNEYSPEMLHHRLPAAKKTRPVTPSERLTTSAGNRGCGVESDVASQSFKTVRKFKPEFSQGGWLSRNAHTHCGWQSFSGTHRGH